MIKILFDTIFAVLTSVANIILTPLNTLIINNFPQTAILINRFNEFMTTYIGSNLGFFGSLLPPKTKAVILFYLSYLIIRYIVVLNAHLILKVFRIIKNIKVW